MLLTAFKNCSLTHTALLLLVAAAALLFTDSKALLLPRGEARHKTPVKSCGAGRADTALSQWLRLRQRQGFVTVTPEPGTGGLGQSPCYSEH